MLSCIEGPYRPPKHKDLTILVPGPTRSGIEEIMVCRILMLTDIYMLQTIGRSIDKDTDICRILMLT